VVVIPCLFTFIFVFTYYHNPQFVQDTRSVKSTICPRDQGSQIHNMFKG